MARFVYFAFVTICFHPTVPLYRITRQMSANQHGRRSRFLRVPKGSGFRAHISIERYLEAFRKIKAGRAPTGCRGWAAQRKKSRRSDSNRRPTVYETVALPLRHVGTYHCIVYCTDRPYVKQSGEPAGCFLGYNRKRKAATTCYRTLASLKAMVR